MGRPEPSVMFSQTFVHNQLDEYVDEVIFAEPVVITACEFLEQNASSASPSVTLTGATSPPSFALEVFVHSEGETRFRRLCQPFLYSHSSSNVLEVEAVVTNLLVVRGSYQSLTLVIYGNTAEDLGQFNIEVDLDSSLTKTVSFVEESLEDLPSALQRTDKFICPLKMLSPDLISPDISVETKHILHLTFKVLVLPNLGDAIKAVVNSVISAASNHATQSLHYLINGIKKHAERISEKSDGNNCELAETSKELMYIYNRIGHASVNPTHELPEENSFSEFEAEPISSRQLMDTFSGYFKIDNDSGISGHPQLSQKKNAMLWASLALFLCSGKESCFHFVNGGGMKQLEYFFSHGYGIQDSSVVTLMLLGVAEQATRHSIGCEGFLGWWPRDDENVPSGFSEGYNQLLKLLLQKQRHDVASLSTFILQRLSCYEAASRYEYSVLSVLGVLSSGGKAPTATLDMLSSAKLQLKKLLKLIDCRGPIEDPSPAARASQSLLLGEADNILSYKATSALVTPFNSCFSKQDIDPYLLVLLKERGFLPLSAALLASPVMHSNVGTTMELFLDITAYIEAIILSLLYCRSGLLFLLHDPELASTVILALRGSASKKEHSIPLRYASFLISKGFFCPPQEVGIIVETHLRIVNAIDCLTASKPQSEELLWSLWELCCLSRSNCGRMALLAVGHFPEAVAILLAALHSVKELDTLSLTTGSSPLNLAIFHSAVEIFEVIVTDSSASSLGSWMEHAKELHRALHSSSPGSSRKDAPTRLLEWVDASVVYHRTGASGLLRYAALLASGGDAHVSSSNLLASDAMDVDTVGDISSSSDGNLIDNLLGKSINEGRFLGVTLRDSSVSQLTTTFRILALISDNSAVATALYDECAVTVIHAILIDCRLMLERSSNNYDYLVDESTDGNSTADLLLERNREQCLVDLLIPCLVLLINLLKRLQEAKEQHRNTKLLKALLQLHREVSPKLAACSTDLFYPYPDVALGFKAVCHLLASSLACWPLYGWTPGLFHFLLDSLHATSMLALGPKEACGLLFLLTDLLPEEGVWLWKNGMPILSTLRTLAIGTLLGPLKEQEINWYLQAGNPEKLLSQLTPALLDKIAEIILHYANSTSVVIQDMLRVFIVRIACLSANSASILLQPMILWIRGHLSDFSSLSDIDAWKVYKLLNFLAILLEHPHTKPLMLTEGAQMLSQVLEICTSITSSDANHHLESKNFMFQLSWCIPVFRSISLISNSTTPVRYPGMYNRYKLKTLTAEDCSRLLSYCLNLCKALPVGRELLACLSAFKAISSSAEGRSALHSIYWRIQSSGNQEPDSESKHDTDVNYDSVNASEWKKHPPLLCCWLTLLRSISSENLAQVYVIEALAALSLGALHFSLDGRSLNMDNVAAVKFLFGLPPDVNSTDVFSGDNIKYVKELTSLLDSKISSYEYSASSDKNTTLYQVKESAESLLLLLQMSTDSDQGNNIISRCCSLLSLDVTGSSRIHKIKDRSAERVESFSLSKFGDMFLWECPENIRDRMSQTALSAKRKMSSMDGVSRRPRDHSPAETMAQSSYSRGSVPAAPSGPSRRDTFRQRKPNTSRPPSMHVDDYVARERNVDGTTSSNVITVPRVGPTSGRPPSIHVDEFMARQRERQNPVGMAVIEPATQVKAAHAEKEADADKVDKSKQLKPDLDDDFDIVFEGVESDPDDKVPSPQPDDNLQQPAPVIIEQNSPHSVVAETESDINDGSQFSHLNTPVSSNFDENTWNEFSSRMSVSHQDMSLTREASISTDKKFFKPSEDAKNVIATTSSGFSSIYGRNSRPSVQPVDSRMAHPNYYSKNNPQVITSSQGFYDQKFQSNQPPLPPMPPPPTIPPVQSQNAESVQSQSFVNSMSDVQPPLPPGFHVRPDYSATSGNLDSKYARVSRSSPGGSSRQQPPLPPTPPPYSVNTSNLQPFKPSTSQPLYNQNSVGSTEFSHMSILPSTDTRLNSLSASGPTISSYPPALMQPLIFSRPTSVPIGIYGSSSTSHQGDNSSSMPQNFPIALSTIPSMQSLTQLQPLQPLQPPQLPRPPQPPQHLRPPIPSSPQSDQSFPLLQNSGQLQQLQMLQPPQVSAHVYLPAMQQDNIQHTLQRVQHAQPQVQHQQERGSQQTSDDIGMSLQHYFSSPEAIQSLLSDRDKLCQLLEQHPKLMQLLQEKLGHL